MNTELQRPSVLVVIVCWSSEDVIADCLRSLLSQDYGGTTEIVVWDNASPDGTVKTLAPFRPGIRIVESDENLGFARANNAAARLGSSELVCFLNPDTWFERADTLTSWVDELLSDSSVGLCAPALRNADGTRQASVAPFARISSSLVLALGLRRLLPGRYVARLTPSAVTPATSSDVDWVKGAAVLLRRTDFVRAGQWSEASFMYGEDQELCWSLRRLGLRIRYFAGAEVVHLDDHSSSKRWNIAAKARRASVAELSFVRRRYSRGRFWMIATINVLGFSVRAVALGALGRREAASAYVGMVRGACDAVRPSAMRHADRVP